MDNQRYKNIILESLKEDGRLWNEEKTEFNQRLLFDLVDKIDETVIDLLLQKGETRDNFFVKVKDTYVFNTNEFKFFMEANKINNSYTEFINQIGLFDGTDLIKNKKEVVLNFPFKDCVLEGGQATEEGTDIYFEYDKKITKAQEKQGYKEQSYNKKQSKRKEIFFNQVLAQDEIDRLFDDKAFVNLKRYTRDGEQKVSEIKRDETGLIKENLIIKGNNLLVLHSLKSQFARQVKCIYIDPPYNTGTDEFNYNDNFNHSTWLTFMKNRLEIGWQLLKDDGVLLIQTDNTENHYLKILCDEILGIDKFVTQLAVEMSATQGMKVGSAKIGNIVKNTEYILVYSKNGNKAVVTNLLYDYRAEYDGHYSKFLNDNNVVCNLKDIFLEKYPNETFSNLKDMYQTNKMFKDFVEENLDSIFRYDKVTGFDLNEFEVGKVIRVKRSGREYYLENKGDSIEQLMFLEASYGKTDDFQQNRGLRKIRGDWWSGYYLDMGNVSKEGQVKLKNGKKPERLLHDLLRMILNSGDIVLDFFGGSGTTASVAHKLGYQYISCEQLDNQCDLIINRLNNVIGGDNSGTSNRISWQGGGDFIYFELAKWNEQAKEEILNCNDLEELISFFDVLCQKYFLNYNMKIDEFRNKVIKEKEFINLTLEEQKNIFLAMLDLNQMYVQKTEMSDNKFGINKEDQELTKMFYGGE